MRGYTLSEMQRSRRNAGAPPEFRRGADYFSVQAQSIKHISARKTVAMLATDTTSSPRRKYASTRATSVPAMPDQIVEVEKRIAGNTITARTL